ncbi:MAG: DUF3892 domain-containing protein [Candidatus Thiodiazotropha sp.]
MAERAVTRTKKDQDGDILALCKPGEYWSPRPKANAIQDIESGAHSYYVPWSDGTKTPIHVVNGPTGKYLRTDKDNTTRNNLDDLPDC